MSASRKSNTYYIIQDSQMIPVEEEFYYEYSRAIWRTRSKAQSRGECMCPKKNLWRCEGMCTDCRYYAPKSESYDRICECAGEKAGPVEAVPENLVLDALYFEQLLCELDEIDPDGRRIAALLMEKKSGRTIADELGVPETTFRRRLDRIRKELKKRLQKNISESGANEE